MNTVFGIGYPPPPEGVSKRKWGKACDLVAQSAWVRGREPDWSQVRP
jgi:hypothetical protein